MRGVTRDRSYHEADWNGVDFKLIDTGGIEMGDDDAFQGSIRNQALAGANEADVILFIVDGKTGVNADDEAVARILRKTSKPVFLVVNKLDTPNREDEIWEFYQLGLGDPWPVSAMHGHGSAQRKGTGTHIGTDNFRGPQCFSAGLESGNGCST